MGGKGTRHEVLALPPGGYDHDGLKNEKGRNIPGLQGCNIIAV